MLNRLYSLSKCNTPDKLQSGPPRPNEHSEVGHFRRSIAILIHPKTQQKYHGIGIMVRHHASAKDCDVRHVSCKLSNTSQRRAVIMRYCSNNLLCYFSGYNYFSDQPL